jgi:hypothetical protein
MTFSRVFVTGDVHGDIDIAKIDYLQEVLGTALKADPADKLLLICGDFGVIFDTKPNDWERRMKDYYRRLYEEYGVLTATCFGNHENYDRIAAEVPMRAWCGGTVLALGEHGPFYLPDGQRYEIAAGGGRFSLLSLGGAASHDYFYRTPHVSWWPQEIPSKMDMFRGLENIKAYGNHVDYIISHTIPAGVKERIFKNPYDDSLPNIRTVENYLQCIFERADWIHWFAGHHHIDLDLPEYKMSLLYNAVVEFDPEVLAGRQPEKAQ